MLLKIKSFFSKPNLISFLIIVLIFLLDRYSKFQVLNFFNDTSFYVNDFLNLSLVWNTGIGFGLFSFEKSVYYNSTTLLIGLIILILLYFVIKSERTEKIIFSIIIGGALGNFYDRLIFKAVPDFIDFHYGSFHWFTFNLADVFITLGIIIYILKDYFQTNK
tara:strand:- start:45 stop:530 length:486 start_codon:yes stop_codon:yes gene_type:complete